MQRAEWMSIIATTACMLTCAARPVAAATDWRAPSTVTRVCSGCHGIDGNGPWPMVPRLAGQDAAYLSRQIDAYRAAPRPPSIEHPGGLGRPKATPAQARGGYAARTYMTGPAHDLAAADQSAVVEWYSKNTPAPGRGSDPALGASGRAIYEQGVPARGVPACAACHGAEAQGAAPFPRLAGQHAAYVVTQLHGFRDGDRPLGTEMQAVTKMLTDPEITAVAAYLQSL